MHITQDILDRIEQMNAKDLDRLQEAIDRRRQHASASTVVERRSYQDGILQLEYRVNPKTGTERGPYWYFHFREGSKQRTLYLGKTDNPEGKLAKKRGYI